MLEYGLCQDAISGEGNQVLWISTDIRNRILPMRICDNTLAFAKEGDVRRVRCTIRKMTSCSKKDG